MRASCALRRAAFWFVLALLTVQPLKGLQADAASLQGVWIRAPGEGSDRAAPLLHGRFGWSEGRGELDLRLQASGWLDLESPAESLFNLESLTVGREWDDVELELGVGTVTWGISEERSPLDVLTPRAVFFGTWGGPKLGQPIVDLNYFLDPGSIELVFMPLARPVHFGEHRWVTWGGHSVDTDVEWNWHPSAGLRWTRSSGPLDFSVSYVDGLDRIPQTTPISGETVRVEHARTRSFGASLEWAAGVEWSLHLEGAVAYQEDDWNGRAILGAEWFPLPYLSLQLQQGLTARSSSVQSVVEDDILVGGQLITEKVRAGAKLFIDPGSRVLHPSVHLRVSLTETLFAEATWIGSHGDGGNEPRHTLRQPNALMVSLAQYF